MKWRHLFKMTFAYTSRTKMLYYTVYRPPAHCDQRLPFYNPKITCILSNNIHATSLVVVNKYVCLLSSPNQ